MIGEISKFGGIEKLALADDGDTDLEILENFDDTQMIHVIYLAFIGANKNEKKTFDEFLDLYHGDFSETVELYIKLISDSMLKGNKFADGLKASTAAGKKN